MKGRVKLLSKERDTRGEFQIQEEMALYTEKVDCSEEIYVVRE